MTLTRAQKTANLRAAVTAARRNKSVEWERLGRSHWRTFVYDKSCSPPWKYRIDYWPTTGTLHLDGGKVEDETPYELIRHLRHGCKDPACCSPEPKAVAV